MRHSFKRCDRVAQVDEYGMPLLESKLTVPFSRSDTLLEASSITSIPYALLDFVEFSSVICA